MAFDPELADRIRGALARAALVGAADVREVRMFGGLTFMVDDKIAVTANTHGELMVRCDPDRAEELLDREGARWPEMRGRPMSRGWIVVSAAASESEQAVAAWVEEAVDYNRRTA